MVGAIGRWLIFLDTPALIVTNLLTVSAPDKLIEDLAILKHDEPKLGIAKAHLYPVGGTERLLEWLTRQI